MPVGGAAAISVGFVGGTPLTFQWLQNGLPIAGETNAAFVLNPGRSPARARIRWRSRCGRVGHQCCGRGHGGCRTRFSLEPPFRGTSADEAIAVATDASGNTYAAGYFTGTASFGGTNLTSQGGEDLFVAKYNVAGTLLWVTAAGGSGNDRLSGIALDSGGTRVIVVGSFAGTLGLG